jgi:hypothetical protein
MYRVVTIGVSSLMNITVHIPLEIGDGQSAEKPRESFK